MAGLPQPVSISRHHIESFDPATLEKLGDVPAHSSAEITSAIQHARSAQAKWARYTVQERVAYLLRSKDYLIDHIDRLADLISHENGKPRVEALTSDLFPIVYLIDYFSRMAPKFLADEPVRIRFGRWLRRSSALVRDPRGVVAIISPWNYPFSIPAGEAVMALIAGNAAILKPAQATCLIGEAIGEVLNASGLPDGLFQVLHCSGAELIKQPVDFISFTGSVETGKKVMAVAAEQLIPVMLELGGKDPMIVCRDANLEVAASAAVWGAFMNSGQTCASVERLYVDHAIADDFIRRLVEKTRQLRQGRGIDPNTDIGPLTTQDQFNVVSRQMENARRNGATFLLGGEPNPAAGPGYFYKPTILTNIGQDWECVQEETFGPTLPIIRFRTEEEAIALANDSKYGLTASIWTQDLRRGKALARQIIAGSVIVNDCVLSHALAETPWGGPKNTGIGRTHGKYGLLEFTEMKHIHLNRWTGVKNPWWFHYAEPSFQSFKSTALLLRSGFSTKTRGAFGVLSHLRDVYKKRL